MKTMTKERLEEIKGFQRTYSVDLKMIAELIDHAGETLERIPFLEAVADGANDICSKMNHVARQALDSRTPSRAEIAMRLHAGVLANPFIYECIGEASNIKGGTLEEKAANVTSTCAKIAVRHADHLLAELNRAGAK